MQQPFVYPNNWWKVKLKIHITICFADTCIKISKKKKRRKNDREIKTNLWQSIDAHLTHEFFLKRHVSNNKYSNHHIKEQTENKYEIY